MFFYPFANTPKNVEYPATTSEGDVVSDDDASSANTAYPQIKFNKVNKDDCGDEPFDIETSVKWLHIKADLTTVAVVTNILFSFFVFLSTDRC